MTTIPDLNELRRIAEAARDADPAKANIAVDEFTMEEWIEFDETFDPASVLALLARLREAEACIEDIAAMHVKRERSLIDCSHGPELVVCRTRERIAAYKTTKTEATDREDGSESLSNPNLC